MIISTFAGEPHCDEARRGAYRVMLDGVPLPYCVRADDVAGVAQVVELEDGKPKIDRSTGEATLVRIVGKITIERTDGLPMPLDFGA